MHTGSPTWSTSVIDWLFPSRLFSSLDFPLKPELVPGSLLGLVIVAKTLSVFSLLWSLELFNISICALLTKTPKTCHFWHLYLLLYHSSWQSHYWEVEVLPKGQEITSLSQSIWTPLLVNTSASTAAATSTHLICFHFNKFSHLSCFNKSQIWS